MAASQTGVGFQDGGAAALTWLELACTEVAHSFDGQVHKGQREGALDGQSG